MELHKKNGHFRRCKTLDDSDSQESLGILPNLLDLSFSDNFFEEEDVNFKNMDNSIDCARNLEHAGNAFATNHESPISIDRNMPRYASTPIHEISYSDADDAVSLENISSLNPTAILNKTIEVKESQNVLPVIENIKHIIDKIKIQSSPSSEISNKCNSDWDKEYKEAPISLDENLILQPFRNHCNLETVNSKDILDKISETVTNFKANNSIIKDGSFGQCNYEPVLINEVDTESLLEKFTDTNNFDSQKLGTDDMNIMNITCNIVKPLVSITTCSKYTEDEYFEITNNCKNKILNSTYSQEAAEENLILDDKIDFNSTFTKIDIPCDFQMKDLLQPSKSYNLNGNKKCPTVSKSNVTVCLGTDSFDQEKCIENPVFLNKENDTKVSLHRKSVSANMYKFSKVQKDTKVKAKKIEPITEAPFRKCSSLNETVTYDNNSDTRISEREKKIYLIGQNPSVNSVTDNFTEICVDFRVLSEANIGKKTQPAKTKLYVGENKHSISRKKVAYKEASSSKIGTESLLKPNSLIPNYILATSKSRGVTNKNQRFSVGCATLPSYQHKRQSIQPVTGNTCFPQPICSKEANKQEDYILATSKSRGVTNKTQRSFVGYATLPSYQHKRQSSQPVTGKAGFPQPICSKEANKQEEKSDKSSSLRYGGTIQKFPLISSVKCPEKNSNVAKNYSTWKSSLKSRKKVLPLNVMNIKFEGKEDKSQSMGPSGKVPVKQHSKKIFKPSVINLDSHLGQRDENNKMIVHGRISEHPTQNHKHISKRALNVPVSRIPCVSQRNSKQTTGAKSSLTSYKAQVNKTSK